ncbi:HPP family protein [Azospirillum halopraeferens]|uniref:HPP family protein n=1 Tax=Azospirillum halopraeferens TaxID=34010 RepID=UPI0004245D5C|nr:HPP family protein [Azospirillum halopraeferens]
MPTASDAFPTAWIRRFVPPAPTVNWLEWARAGTGALLGILATALVSGAVAATPAGFVMLIAPMGASSVLLFAAPASPLAQPWSIVGGNLVAALVGVTCARWIGDPVTASAAAVALAIALMFPLRCLHPPAGAVALTAVLGGPTVAAQGYGFALVPVALNSIILLAVALAYNNATGRRYPHAAAPDRTADHGTADAAPGRRVGFTPADLDAVLHSYNEVIDVTRDDLDALFRQAEMRAYHRQFGEVTCADIMSRDVVSVSPDTPAERIRVLLREHRIKAVPVVDADRRVLGTVTRFDVLEDALWSPHRSRVGNLVRLVRHSVAGRPGGALTAAELMSRPARTATANRPIAELVPPMSDEGLHHVPVVDAAGRLVGIVTQSDLIAGLYRGRVTGRSDYRDWGVNGWRRRDA